MSDSFVESYLSKEQGKLFQLALDGVSFFYTGNAGTGKTRALMQIASSLTEKIGHEAVGITATTGIAATSIAGQTIHSWAGIGIGRGSRYKLLQGVLANKSSVDRWRNCRCLIIDEVSMLDQHAFDVLEFIARKVRKNEACFGGIQLILCGDFQQLPPVTSLKADKVSYDADMPFCFKSVKWHKCIKLMLKLETVHRQTDPKYLRFLSEVRMGGELSAFAQEILHEIPLTEGDAVDEGVTYLYCHKVDVERKNLEILSTIPGKEYVHHAQDGGTKAELKVCPLPERFPFKVGAKVMLLRNMHRKELKNGSLGKIIGVSKGKPVVRFNAGTTITIEPHVWQQQNEDGITLATRRQLPLSLAWAMTVHKSQGQTLPRVAILLNGVFEFGQAYVGLSRAVSLSSLSVFSGWAKRIPCTPPSIAIFNRKITSVQEFDPQSASDEVLYPYMIQPSSTEVGEEEPALATGEALIAPLEPSWTDDLSLPADIDISHILKDLLDRDNRSAEYKRLCGRLVNEYQEGSIIASFFAYCWLCIEMIYTPTGTDRLMSMKDSLSGSKAERKGREFIDLKTSGNLTRRWDYVLCTLGEADQPFQKMSLHQRTLMVDIVVILRKTLAGLLLDEAINDDEVDGALHDRLLSKAELGKIRYLGGWVLFKERNAAQVYVRKCVGSKDSSVNSRVSDENKVLDTIDKLCLSRDKALETTQYPDSFAHIEYHNRGGLLHINDATYLFFVQLEKTCAKHFTKATARKYQRDCLRVARQMVRNDTATQVAWEQLVSDLSNGTCGEKVFITFRGRLLKRYLNMRSKEYIKSLKREMKASKSVALRSALAAKKTRSKIANDLQDTLHGIFDDKSLGKMASHLKLKAFALEKGEAAFVSYTKTQLHYLYSLYGMKFKKSQKKAILSKNLYKVIVDAVKIPVVGMALKACYDSLTRLCNEGKTVNPQEIMDQCSMSIRSVNQSEPAFQVISREVSSPTQIGGSEEDEVVIVDEAVSCNDPVYDVDNFTEFTTINLDDLDLLPYQTEVNETETATLVSTGSLAESDVNFKSTSNDHNQKRNAESTNDDAVALTNTNTFESELPFASRHRLKAFKPTKQQEAQLKEDHAQKLSKEDYKQRAAQFEVHESQIKRWHKMHAKKLAETKVSVTSS